MLAKNKRGGSLATTVLVILVLIAISSALFAFGKNSRNFSNDIANTKFADEIFINEGLAEFYISDVGRNALVKTYYEFVNVHEGQYDFIANRIVGAGDSAEFGELHAKLNENFEEKFLENFKEDFANREFEDNYTSTLQAGAESATVDFNGQNILVSLGEVGLLVEREGVKINYFPEFSIKLEFARMGLNTFDYLYLVKEQCKTGASPQEVRDCFATRLINFDVELVDENAVDSNLILTTKRKFFIDEEFKKIEIRFVVK